MNAKKQPLLPVTGNGLADQGMMEEENWPNLWDECREMLEVAILVYTLADLRDLARKQKLSADHERLLTLPVSAEDVMYVVQANLSALQKNIKDADFYLTSMQSIKTSVQRPSIDPISGEAVLQESKLVVFDDTNAAKELVYGIAVNGARRRITVAFRGSVTLTDFMTDAKAYLVDIPNPVQGAGQPLTVSVHHGFYDYLLGSSKRPNQNGAPSSTKLKNSKCDMIMQQVIDLMQQYPGYRLYVTGHSLGGALATLFAFEAAANRQIMGTVTCINVASPKVGNLAFRRAFESLQRAGRLRCLRIANYKDLVTLLPDRGSFSCLYLSCCQSRVYRHVGVELKLHNARRYEISLKEVSHSYLGLLCQDMAKQVRHALALIVTLPCVLCCREDFLKYHGCREYMERLLGNERDLSRMHLNDL